MNEKEIIMENLDTVDTVIEMVPEKVGFNWKKAGLVGLVVVAAAALGYEVYKVVEKKKADKAQASNHFAIVEASDFEEETAE